MSTYDAAAQVDVTNDYVSHLQTQADAAIARLTDAATTWNMDTLFAVSNLSLGSLTTATGTRPTLTALTLPTFTAANFSGLVAPTLPAPPSLAAGTSPMWSEDFWSGLKTKIDTYLANITSSDDLDSLVDKLSNETTRMQSALYAKDYERRSQTLRDLYTAAEANTGARGFNFPNSLTAALKLDAQQKFQFDLTQTSRELINHVFEWSKSNWQFVLHEGVAAHNADVEFNVRYLDTAIKSYSAQVGALVDKYRGDVAAAVSQAEVRIREYATQLDTELEKQKTLKEIQLKDAGFDVEVAKANAEITGREMQLKIQDFAERVRNFLETAKTNMQILDENAKNRISAAAAAAAACSSLASAASTITVNTAGA